MRYRIIDSMLRNKYRKYPAYNAIRVEVEDMLHETGLPESKCKYPKRTFQEDLRSMREDADLGFFAPIEYHTGKEGYYYSDENYTLPALKNITSEDLIGIDYVRTFFMQYRGIPLMDDIIHSMNKVLDAAEVRYSLQSNDEDSFIVFEQTPRQQGGEHLKPLMEAIRERVPVRIVYQKFESNEPREHVLSPYVLKQYRQRWYLIGRLEGKDDPTTFGLDRIQSVKLLPAPGYEFPGSFSVADYFRYAFGVFVTNGPPVTIVLSFTPHQGEYIKSQPIHPSQELLVDNEQECRISLTVCPAIELLMQILSYGDQVEVLEPDSLRNEVAQAIQRMNDLYR